MSFSSSELFILLLAIQLESFSRCHNPRIALRISSKRRGPLLTLEDRCHKMLKDHVPPCEFGCDRKQLYTIETRVMVTASDDMKWNCAGHHFFVAEIFLVDNLGISLYA